MINLINSLTRTVKAYNNHETTLMKLKVFMPKTKRRDLIKIKVPKQSDQLLEYVCIQGKNDLDSVHKHLNKAANN